MQVLVAFVSGLVELLVALRAMRDVVSRTCWPCFTMLVASAISHEQAVSISAEPNKVSEGWCSEGLEQLESP